MLAVGDTMAVVVNGNIEAICKGGEQFVPHFNYNERHWTTSWTNIQTELKTALITYLMQKHHQPDMGQSHWEELWSTKEPVTLTKALTLG